MDEEEYRTTHQDIVRLHCVFEKSILSSRLSCVKSRKVNLAEREAVCCSADACLSVCKLWLMTLREKSQFSLQLKEINDAANVLPHAKEMKVQVGGINGLSKLLSNRELVAKTENQRVLYDVFGTLKAGVEKYGKLEQFPFDEIMKSVASFKLRKFLY